MSSRESHWEAIYHARAPSEHSWYQPDPSRSLLLIGQAGIDLRDPIIDVGGGTSLLVDRLLDRGYSDLTVLDLAPTALAGVRERLSDRGAGVELIHEDVTRFMPARRYALWHDRAVFHFLTEPADRRAYVVTLNRALRPGGHAILATFSLNGPPKCSGLDVVRYDAIGLTRELGPGFLLVHAEEEAHVTPAQQVQTFQYCMFRAAKRMAPT